MIQVANPIYDSVFKYMMQNKKVCIIMLSVLLDRNIIDVEIVNNELIRADLKKFAVLRLDFLAKIQNPDGTTEMVSIELQKSEKSSEIVRFRRYLAKLYDKEANQTQTIEKVNRKGKIVREKKEIPIHIVAIYILGHSLEGVEEPVIYYSPQAKNASGEIVENVGLNPFFRYLSHDSIVVQIPYLRKKSRTRVERFLEIFDQSNTIPDNEHFMLLDDSDDKSEDYITIVRQLASAAADEQVKTTMDFEDEFAEDLENWTELEGILEEQKEQLAEQKETITQQEEKLTEQKETITLQEEKLTEQKETITLQEEKLTEQKETITQQEETIAQHKKKLNQQEETIAQQREQLANFVRMMFSMGVSAEEISVRMKISVEEISKIIQS